MGNPMYICSSVQISLLTVSRESQTKDVVEAFEPEMASGLLNFPNTCFTFVQVQISNGNKLYEYLLYPLNPSIQKTDSQVTGGCLGPAGGEKKMAAGHV